MREDTAIRPSVEDTTEYATRVTLADCSFGNKQEAFLGAIIAALSSNIVSEGVNRVGTLLTEAAREETKGVTAHRNVEVTNEAFGPCIQVIRGWFYVSPQPSPEPGSSPYSNHPKFAEAKKWLGKETINLGQFTKLWRTGMWLAAPPDFIFEGHIAPASKNNALTIVPQYIKLNEPIFKRWLRKDTDRFVTISFAFSTPVSKVDVEKNPTAAIILGNLKQGEVVKFDPPTALEMIDNVALNRWPHESNWFNLTVGTEPEPWTVSARVTETQGANAFLGFISSVFVSSKDTITSELQTLVDPAQRNKARDTFIAAENKSKKDKEDAYVTFFENRLTAVDALSACEKGGDDSQKTIIDTYKALNALNQSARTAREKEPVPQKCVDIIRSALFATKDKIQTACAAVSKEISKDVLVCGD